MNPVRNLNINRTSNGVKFMKISNGVKNIIILAIETSCDDTCVAIVEAPKFKILSNIVSSQVEIHKKWGGVYPSLAKREHQRNLPIIIKKGLKKTKKIDLVAITIGPGLEPCLWVGINFARSLAQKLNVPVVPVNHIEAHTLINFIDKIPEFPAIALVVSGGHTQLILVKDIGKYKILGETRDDAAGECFDKTARILGLGYPGGPAIAAEARRNPVSASSNKDQVSVKLPRPMINQKNYDFSFSGLKTAVLYSFKNYTKKAMAKEIQQAIIDVLIKKTIKAAKDYKAKTIILGGGVTANSELRRQFKLKIKKLKFSPFGGSLSLRDISRRETVGRKIRFFAPSKNLCTDNAVMTAIAGYYNQNKKTKNYNKIEARSNLRIN